MSKLHSMPASYELNEDQVRQLLFDLESAYNEFMSRRVAREALPAPLRCVLVACAPSFWHALPWSCQCTPSMPSGLLAEGASAGLCASWVGPHCRRQQNVAPVCLSAACHEVDSSEAEGWDRGSAQWCWASFDSAAANACAVHPAMYSSALFPRHLSLAPLCYSCFACWMSPLSEAVLSLAGFYFGAASKEFALKCKSAARHSL